METYIYKVSCKETTVTDTYIGHKFRKEFAGSGLKSLCKRGANSRAALFINERGGWDNWEVSILEHFKFGHTKQMTDRLKELQKLHNATLNGRPKKKRLLIK